MRLRTVATMLGALAIVAGSFWVTLTFLRRMETANAPASVQTATSPPPTQTTSAPQSGATTRSVALDSFYVVPGCSFSGRSSEKVLTTLTQQYSFALTAPLPFPPFGAGPGKIRVRLQVLEGQLSILALERIGDPLVIGQKAVAVTSQPVQVDVDLRDVAKARQIVLQNSSPNGTSARARIFSIDAVF
jgi:hypothetical protein